MNQTTQTAPLPIEQVKMFFCSPDASSLICQNMERKSHTLPVRTVCIVEMGIPEPATSRVSRRSNQPRLLLYIFPCRVVGNQTLVIQWGPLTFYRYSHLRVLLNGFLIACRKYYSLTSRSNFICRHCIFRKLFTALSQTGCFSTFCDKPPGMLLYHTNGSTDGPVDGS